MAENKLTKNLGLKKVGLGNNLLQEVYNYNDNLEKIDGSIYDDTELKNQLDQKQNKLIAGQNITIGSDGKINAKDTVYNDSSLRTLIGQKQNKLTAGNGISIGSNNVISAITQSNDIKKSQTNFIGYNGNSFECYKYAFSSGLIIYSGIAIMKPEFPNQILNSQVYLDIQSDEEVIFAGGTVETQYTPSYYLYHVQYLVENTRVNFYLGNDMSSSVQDTPRVNLYAVCYKK